MQSACYNVIMKRILTILFAFFILTSAANSAEPPQKAVELYNAGIDLYQMGDVQKSINSFNDAIKLAPDFYEAYYNLGQIQASTNKLDDAIKTYTTIDNLRPNDDENLYSLAKVLYKRGYLARSLSYYQKIPPRSSYFADAQKDIAKLTQRQKELKDEAATKEAAAQKLIMAQKSIEQKFANQNQVAGMTQPIDKTEQIVGKVEPKAAELKPVQEQKVVPHSPVIPSKIMTYEGIGAPSGVAMDAYGNVYIASFSENTIYKINTENEKSIFAGPDILGGPIGLAIDIWNNVYVANYTKGNVLKISQNGDSGVLTTIKSPYCLNITNNTLFITEQGTNTVLRYAL